MGRTRSPWKKGGLGLASFTLSLALLEIGLHLLAPESFLRPQTPMKLGFLHWNAFRGNYIEPNYEQRGVSINAAGRRGPALAPSPPRRIVCLGDSSTFGVWVGGSLERKLALFDNYPDLLAESLTKAGYTDWQVVNAGVPGSHAGHSLRVLRREVLALEPDIVTLRIGVNDHSHPALPWLDDPDTPILRDLFYLIGRSRLFMLGVEAHYRLTVDPAVVGRVMPLQTFRRSLESIVEESRNAGFHLMLIDYPVRKADASDVRAHKAARFYGDATVNAFLAVHADYQRVVADVAREQNVPLLVTAPTLHDESAPGFRVDLIHPNARGMRQTADLLLKALEGEGWLD